jgi:hypothetical protein
MDNLVEYDCDMRMKLELRTLRGLPQSLQNCQGGANRVSRIKNERATPCRAKTIAHRIVKNDDSHLSSSPNKRIPFAARAETLGTVAEDYTSFDYGPARQPVWSLR